jgi:O-antigen ligase
VIINKKNDTASNKATYLSYLTGAYLFFYYLEASLRWPVLQSIRFHFVFGLLLTVLCLFKMLSSKKEPKKLTFGKVKKIDQPLVNITYILIAILGFYTIFSMDREVSNRIYMDRVIKFSLVTFFIYMSVDKIKDLQVIVVFILLAWFKVGSEGFLGWITGSMMWQNQGIQRLHGATAFVGHPNSFSAFGLGCIPFALFLLKSANGLIAKAFLSSLLLFSFVIVLFTGSRSGYVALFLIIIWLFLQMKKNKGKMILVSVLIILAVAPIIPEQYYGRFESIYTGKAAGGDSSGTRMVIMEDAVAIYLEYPFGIGVQAFSRVRMDMFDRFQNIHMLYLEVLTNIGPIGFIVFAMFVMRLLKLNKWNIARAELFPKDPQLIFLMAISKAVIAFVLLRLFFGLFAMDLYEPHWWLMLGLTLTTHKLLVQHKKDNSELYTDKLISNSAT